MTRALLMFVVSPVLLFGCAELEGDAPDAGPDAMSLPPLELTVCGDGSGDHVTVGAAIAAATPGSTLHLCAGTYHERLEIDGKSTSPRPTLDERQLAPGPVDRPPCDRSARSAA